MHFFDIWTTSGRPKVVRTCGDSIILTPKVLRATTACTFSTSQLPKVVRRWCPLYIFIFTFTCASRHNGGHFSTQPLQCVWQHHLASLHLYTHMAIHSHIHAATPLRSATRDSTSANELYRHTTKTQSRNQKKNKNGVKNYLTLE